MARLILDTGVLVEGVRGRLDLADLTDEDDVSIPAVVIAEYLTGVLLDKDHSRRAAQKAFLDDILSIAPVENYDPAIAEHHAELLAYVRQAGQARGAHDLIIAATARATGRILVTTDAAAEFGKLPDVETRLIAPGE
ncbi:tRNA(fMet)-specific endonuclease VapC [Kibdelosporangium banguiense]|uniref:Ribonuclease VapC n=1 Tax=Kibdelosporangium banguiense TaxID=1365924 RepID=A0ABS4THD2_9PSEU|nr:PIN domain-containing protein [Kibdelosporangium banguiense]MBP2323751.1 tRNA(fMet)-specific endonuclease VapC [Kibdelosporangium banguiense]